ncbi:MAG: SPFH/Band 7/PHB domain protein [Oscillospiraceae bacterium]|jgi:regulator of protease activity HflC (stomatin/prohibitin superfamily)
MQYIIPIVLIVAVIALVARNVAIVPQANAYVVERLGKYKHTWNAGIHIKIPFVDRISNRVSLKEQVLDFEPQSVITKDNVSMKIDTVVYLVIFDPKLATYGVEHVIPAIENLTATTLRNLIGELTLDDTLTSRDTVNSQMQTLLDVATDPWGIKVNRVELKNIIPPRDIQEAMEKQMRAEREKREAVLKAEGSKQARILEATGLKEATVLQAEAAKQKAILEAQADREAAITRAEGQANAIRKVKEAEAQGIQMIKDAQADDSVIRLRSLATLEEMAKGQATTLIIPSDLAGLAGNLSALKAALDSGKKPEEK